MSSSSFLSHALSQRPARPSSAPIPGNSPHVQARPATSFFPDPPAPLSYPVAEKLAGQPIAEQVSLVMSDRARFLGEFPSRRVMQERCKRITPVYRELDAMGFQVTDVTTFDLKQARALLERWKSNGLSKKTIYNRWNALRSWAIALNKHGMLGSIEEYWPDFGGTAASVETASASRVLSPVQIKERSDFLREHSDKTAYLIDRLTREAEMSRVDALEIELVAAQGVAFGQDMLRCGNGASVRVYWHMAQHRALMQEVVDFMAGRNRLKLGWPDLDIEAAIAKYSLRMSYVNRCMFPREDKQGGTK